MTPVTRILAAAAMTVAAVPALAADAEHGESLFARFCATCHGLDAMGNGPMSGVLLIQPPDLTALTARNEGTFPMARVVMRIDGRDPLTSHGSPMPVYGDFFEGGRDVPLKAETGQPILTSEPIADLISYLQQVQADTQ